MAKSIKRLGAILGASTLALSLVACGAQPERARENADSGAGRAVEEPTAEGRTEAAEATTDDDIDDRDIPAGGMEIDVFSLRVGDCIDTSVLSDGDEIDYVRIVLCSEDHDAEVFYSRMMEGEPGATYPGDEVVLAEATDACQGIAFDEWVGVPYADSTLAVTALYPIQSSWERLDDREVLCIAISKDPVTGGFQGSNL